MAPSSSSRPHFPLHSTWTTPERAHLRSTASAAFDALLQTVSLVSDASHPHTKQTKHSRNHTQLVLPGVVADVASFFLDALDASDGVYCDRYHVDDTELLYVLRPRTMDQPLRFMGLRWSRFSAPLLCRPRDVCVVEYMDSFIDKRGRQGWALCMQSVTHPSCPDFKPHHGIVRSTVHLSGYVAIESDAPGVINLHVVLDWDFDMPPWARNAALTKRLQALDKLDSYLKLKGLDHRPRPKLCSRQKDDVEKSSSRSHAHRRHLYDDTPSSLYNHDLHMRRVNSQQSSGGIPLIDSTTPSFRSQPSNLTFTSSPSMRATLDDDFNGATFESLHMPSHCGVCQVNLRNSTYLPCQLCDKAVCQTCSRPWQGSTDLRMNMNLCVLCDQTMLPTPSSITPCQQQHHRARRTRQSTSRKCKISPSITTADGLLDLSYLAGLTSRSASNSTDSGSLPRSGPSKILE
ncbi:hypothetical protein, variant [Aphanomyces invadans]|uniref:START domain-containing protein n=1 Tax=Aphanomyces invadans TaxID=157072 RepID=A0A024UES1_9STRA|nr:hypothetical protein H310_04492 [Aphanomyces invadans]XP_008867090.1 hypothetical protein, variant [Aphanomyces invadans]ETW04133.1 hypothetical protein H310_04492 [Aphanomyces invadans]ETW04134.1 hypothetical protein, variant [Aphanomyces invadans]|eukprot:XP_008867089.1 hypothetical protein H310_04492 [Aphanomyces invadans]